MLYYYSVCIAVWAHWMCFHLKKICLFKNTKAQCASVLSAQILAQMRKCASTCASMQVRRCASTCAKAQVKVKCRFISVWNQVWRPIIRLYILPPDHWTCSFVCHFNSTESIQACSRFGALNLSYTSPSLSYHLNNVQRLRGEKHDISLKILHQAGFETAREAATSAERHALTIAHVPLSVYLCANAQVRAQVRKFLHNYLRKCLLAQVLAQVIAQLLAQVRKYARCKYLSKQKPLKFYITKLK